MSCAAQCSSHFPLPHLLRPAASISFLLRQLNCKSHSIMRAARYYGKEDIRIEEIPEETTGPDQIKVPLQCSSIAPYDHH